MACTYVWNVFMLLKEKSENHFILTVLTLETLPTSCLQATEEEVDHMREDATVLTSPRFSGREMNAEAQEATRSAVESVKTTLEQLNNSYKELTTMCQQKRDLFIVCVKFHMTTRQVRWVWFGGLGGGFNLLWTGTCRNKCTLRNYYHTAPLLNT